MVAAEPLCTTCGVTDPGEPCRKFVWRRNRFGISLLDGSVPLKTWHRARVRAAEREERGKEKERG